MKKAIGILAMTAALALAGAKTYSLPIMRDVTVGGQQLQAGEYKVGVEGSKMTLTRDGKTVEANVTVRPESKKWDTSTVRMSPNGSSYQVNEIRLRGAAMTIVVNN